MKEPLLTQLVWSPVVPRTAAKPARPVAKSGARGTVRQRAGAALVEATMLESVLDRILVNRLRPLRADATAARKSFEEQVTLRVEADARALRLKDEAQQLRLRVQELEQELAAAQEPRSSWFRRRAVTVRPQEA
jgi:hypothetical protein